MSWNITFSKPALKQLKKLDATVQSRIKKAVYDKLLPNPKACLIPLVGDLSGFYKFRVGDYRLLCRKDDEELTVLVVKVKHRKESYKHLS